MFWKPIVQVLGGDLLSAEHFVYRQTTS